jgi:hypothetical protein
MNRENFGYADAHMVPRQMATAAAGPADWREALDIVALGLPEQVCAVTHLHSSATSFSVIDVLFVLSFFYYCI